MQSHKLTYTLRALESNMRKQKIESQTKKKLRELNETNEMKWHQHWSESQKVGVHFAEEHFSRRSIYESRHKLTAIYIARQKCVLCVYFCISQLLTVCWLDFWLFRTFAYCNCIFERKWTEKFTLHLIRFWMVMAMLLLLSVFVVSIAAAAADVAMLQYVQMPVQRSFI